MGKVKIQKWEYPAAEKDVSGRSQPPRRGGRGGGPGVVDLWPKGV